MTSLAAQVMASQGWQDGMAAVLRSAGVHQQASLVAARFGQQAAQFAAFSEVSRRLGSQARLAKIATEVATPAVQRIALMSLDARHDMYRSLVPITVRLADQTALLGRLVSPTLDRQLRQASRGWALGVKPAPWLAEPEPQTLRYLGSAVHSVNTTAFVVESGADEVDQEPWRVARLGELDDLVAWLDGLHPTLGNKYRGMWNAVRHRGPDFVSQAANSAMELMDHALRGLGPDEKVLPWQQNQGRYADEISQKDGRPHRALRVRYIAAQRGVRASGVQQLVQAVTGTVGELQRLKHAGADEMATAMSQALFAVEYLLAMLRGPLDR